MKLSELMELYDFDLIKDTNGNFYMHDNRDVIERFKNYKSIGNKVINVVDAIPDVLIEEEVMDIEDGYISKELAKKCREAGYELSGVEEAISYLEYAKTISDELIDSKLDLLKAISNCDFEDDYKEGFITEDIFKEYPKFEFETDNLGQGYGYKANYDCEWEYIPDNAIMYIPESAFIYYNELDIEYATEVYTKKDLEELVNSYNCGMSANCLLDILSWESPETYLDGCDFEEKEESKGKKEMIKNDTVIEAFYEGNLLNDKLPKKENLLVRINYDYIHNKLSVDYCIDKNEMDKYTDIYVSEREKNLLVKGLIDEGYITKDTVQEIHKYIEEECERQWNDCQAEEYGEWYEQDDDTKADYYNELWKDKVSPVITIFSNDGLITTDEYYDGLELPSISKDGITVYVSYNDDFEWDDEWGCFEIVGIDEDNEEIYCSDPISDFKNIEKAKEQCLEVLDEILEEEKNIVKEPKEINEEVSVDEETYEFI